MRTVIVNCEAQSYVRCVSCGSNTRTCERYLQVFHNKNGEWKKGERYCIYCEKYARLNNELAESEIYRNNPPLSQDCGCDESGLRMRGWLRMITIPTGHPARDQYGYPTLEVEWGMARPSYREGMSYQWQWNVIPWERNKLPGDVSYRPIRMTGIGIDIRAGDYNDWMLPSPDEGVRPSFDGGLVKYHHFNGEYHPVTEVRTNGNWYITVSSWGEIHFLERDFHEAHPLHRGRRFVKV